MKSEDDILRGMAEERIINSKPTHSNPNPTLGELVGLIHELDVHRVELEIIKEELQLAKEREAEALRERQG